MSRETTPSPFAGSALWARREIRRDWRALLVVAILVAVAGAGVLAAVSGARRAGSAVDRFVQTSGRSPVVLFTDGALEEQLVERLTADRRVEDIATGRLHAIAPAGVMPAAEGALGTMPAGAVNNSRTPIVVEGRSPSGGLEVALAESTAHDLGLRVGDDIELQGLRWTECSSQGDCDLIPAGTAELVGVLRTEQDVIPDPDGWTILIAADAEFGDELAEATSMGWVTSVWLRPGHDPDDFVAEYTSEVTGGVQSDASRASGPLASAYRAADLEHDAVVIGAVVVAVVSVLVIGQAYGRFLARRRSDVPALNALGMRRGQVALTGWLPSVATSTLGAVLAAPLAVALSPLFPMQTARRADPAVGINVDGAVLLIGLPTLVAVGLATGAISAWSWSRHRAESPRAELSLGARVAEALKLGPSSALGTRFALERGAGAQRVPVGSALIGAAAALLIGTAAAVITESLQRAQTDPPTYGVTWDFDVNTDTDPDQLAARSVIDGDDRIDSVTFVMTGRLDVGANAATRSTPVVGVEELAGRFDYTVLDGQPPASASEVAISTAAMRELDVSVGDTVALGGPNGSRDVEITACVTLANADGGTTDGLLADLDVVVDLGGFDLLAELDRQPALLVKAADPVHVEGLRELFESAGAPTTIAVRPTELGLLDEVQLVPAYVAAFVAVLGALATFHALFVTSRRRRGDLMVLRALGGRPRDAANVIRWQALVLTLVAVSVGVPLGIALGRIVWTQIATNRDLVVWIAVPWPVVAAIAGVALVGAVVVLASPPVRVVARRRPADDLRTE
jgi:hypothetical protein